MANGAERAIPFPGIHLAEPADLPPVLLPEPPWYIRFGIWSGVLMSRPQNPGGWGWNPAVITLCLVIVSLVATGAYFIGHMAAEVESLERQQQHTEAVAQDASKVQTFNNASSDKGDGHKVSPTPTPAN